MTVYAHFLIYLQNILLLIHLDCYGKKQIDILKKYERTHELL